jgi:hypothetical protein
MEQSTERVIEESELLYVSVTFVKATNQDGRRFEADTLEHMSNCVCVNGATN